MLGLEKRAERAIAALKAIGAPVFERSENGSLFMFSAEMNVDRVWADYYGEFRGGYGGAPYVAPEVEKIMDRYGLSLEWVNPGLLAAYEA